MSIAPAPATSLGSCEMTVVIVVGVCDRVSSPSRHAYRLHNQVDHSHLVVLKRAGHMIQLTRPDSVMQTSITAGPWRASGPRRHDSALRVGERVIFHACR